MLVGRGIFVGVIAAGAVGVTAVPGAADAPPPTPQMLVADATSVAASATSVHVKATIGASHEKLDLMMVNGKGAVGSISRAGYKIQLIRLGATVYLKASARFYAHYVGGHSAKLLRGKWLEGRATSHDFKPFAPLLDMATLLTQALSIDPTATLTLGPPATIVGQMVIQINDMSGGTLSIAAIGTHFPVRLAAGAENFTFTRWNGPVHLKAPVHVIDLS
jgi:hypothetical protein